MVEALLFQLRGDVNCSTIVDSISSSLNRRNRRVELIPSLAYLRQVCARSTLVS